MLSPEQSRAARGWLNWTQDKLAKMANVSLSTIRDFEKGRRIPISNNLDAISRVIQAQGVRLLFDGERAAGIAIIDPAGPGTTEAVSETILGGDDRA
jgi:transcriptional regulator with XRE-family HTH domain